MEAGYVVVKEKKEEKPFAVYMVIGEERFLVARYRWLPDAARHVRDSRANDGLTMMDVERGS